MEQSQKTEPEYLEGYFDEEEYRMISGIAEQQMHEYHAWQSPTRPDIYWLWSATVVNSGDYVYTGSTEVHQEGFGGRNMEFPLVGGGSVILKGPWHAGSGGLFTATKGKIDLRDRHHTYGCIAEEREPMPNRGHYSHQQRYTKLVHKDEHWILGTFDRIEALAEELTQSWGRPFYYYSKSHGGSIAGRTRVSEIDS